MHRARAVVAGCAMVFGGLTAGWFALGRNVNTPKPETPTYFDTLQAKISGAVRNNNAAVCVQSSCTDIAPRLLIATYAQKPCQRSQLI